VAPNHPMFRLSIWTEKLKNIFLWRISKIYLFHKQEVSIYTQLANFLILTSLFLVTIPEDFYWAIDTRTRKKLEVAASQATTQPTDALNFSAFSTRRITVLSYEFKCRFPFIQSDRLS